MRICPHCQHQNTIIAVTCAACHRPIVVQGADIWTESTSVSDMRSLLDAVEALSQSQAQPQFESQAATRVHAAMGADEHASSKRGTDNDAPVLVDPLVDSASESAGWERSPFVTAKPARPPQHRSSAQLRAVIVSQEHSESLAQQGTSPDEVALPSSQEFSYIAPSQTSSRSVSLAQSSSADAWAQQRRQTANDPLLQMEIGNYRLIEKIGHGGFGAVYRAAHVFLEQSFAIKVLHVNQLTDKVVIERFRREAQALAALRHPHIVHLVDFGLLPEYGFYLVMEYLEGCTLQQAFGMREPFPLSRIQRVVEQLCHVLGYIHDQSMVHRDLKPGNIFLTKDKHGQEFVKLIDFGIVSLSHHADELTNTGAYLGTAKYVSPEQAKGMRDIDGRSDLYALGVILFRLLTTFLPFDGDTPLNVIYNQVHQAPPHLAQKAPDRRWAPALDAFMQTALAKKPNERYPDAEIFAHELMEAIRAQSTLEEGPQDVKASPFTSLSDADDSDFTPHSSSMPPAPSIVVEANVPSMSLSLPYVMPAIPEDGTAISLKAASSQDMLDVAATNPWPQPDFRSDDPSHSLASLFGPSDSILAREAEASAAVDSLDELSSADFEDVDFGGSFEDGDTIRQPFERSDTEAAPSIPSMLSSTSRVIGQRRGAPEALQVASYSQDLPTFPESSSSSSGFSYASPAPSPMHTPDPMGVFIPDDVTVPPLAPRRPPLPKRGAKRSALLATVQEDLDVEDMLRQSGVHDQASGEDKGKGYWLMWLGVGLSITIVACALTLWLIQG